ncbi:alpha/beta fold hydrolase [Shimazuella alba]|uniref:Alpha/beta fold hydrolase n=1 Tax=Shimazuella alba TaxID=2690964 RepID=A0A6I4VZ82_9BACL|nr:alpha/beta hydrolase [Shimazuella alba]MXQ55260.1 alpha/beta fold hydrolase [Shimazuella alba]
MKKIEKGTLKIPGCTLYYEKRGSGPLLLLIHGGNGDADSFPIADELADRYTVVTYDRRGHRRSKLLDENEVYQIRTHSKDASLLLDHLTKQPAYVFGCSSGAVIALDLATHHPQQIKTLIAHEPPLPELLSGVERTHAAETLDALHKKFQTDGVAAMADFANKMGITVVHKPHRSVDITEQKLKDIDFFILQEVPALKDFLLDIPKLKTLLNHTSMQIITAAGVESKGFLPYRYTEALAAHLQLKVTEFPGNHVGCVAHPQEFAKKLDFVMQNR